MNNETIISATENRIAATSNAALAHVREQLATLEAQWSALSANVAANVNQRWSAVRGRIRVALEVPSRAELDRLTARLDELTGKPAHDDHAHVDNGASHEKRSRRR